MLRLPHLILAAVAIAALGTWATVARVAEPVGGPPMSDAAMKMCVSDWYAAHPAHGGERFSATSPLAPAPADTFLVTNFRFDSDGRATQIDTVRVLEGQTVMWKIVSGFHSTTSGNPAGIPTGSAAEPKTTKDTSS